MTNIRSQLNSTLRKFATVLPPQNPIRQFLSKIWSRFLEKSGKYIDVQVGDQKLKMLVQFRHLNPNYEEATLRIWKQLLQLEMTVWDVGANIGVYTAISARAIGSKGSVICWEPAPDSFDATCKHILANGLSQNCEAIQAAVSDTDEGTIRFTVLEGEGTNPMNRISPDISSNGIEVPVMSLDAQLSKSDPPDVMKMDIEGAEVHALYGSTKLLNEHRPIILLAVHPMFLPEFDRSPSDIIDLCKSHNYSTLTMTGKIVDVLEYDEYLLVPSERVEKIQSDVQWNQN